MISIIVPCYNYGRFLNEAIESIVNQSYQDWECIIVNDGSTDDTEQIALNYSSRDKRFRYIYQENAGHSAARNAALTASKGDYIQFLDADDLLESRKLDLQISLLSNTQEFDIIYSGILSFDNDDPNKTLRPAKFFKNAPVSGRNETIINKLLDDNIFLPGCVLMRRKVFEIVGNLKASYGYEDWEFFTRAALLGFNFYYDSRDGTRLLSRSHGSNTTNQYNKMLKSKIQVRNEIVKVMNDFNKKNRLYLSSTYVEILNNKHKALLAEEKATFYLYCDNFLTGLKFLLMQAYYTKSPSQAFRNGVFWSYLRLKNVIKSLTIK